MTPVFRIGLSGCAGGLEAISSSRVLDFAEKAEALGFDGLWLNEEHFQGSDIEVEGRRCHSPLILADQFRLVPIRYNSDRQSLKSQQS